MKIFKIFTLLALAVSVSLSAFAQKSNDKSKADQAFDVMEYYVAIDLYKKEYKSAKDKARKAEIIFKVAECYRLTNNLKQAETWYKKAVKIKYPDPIAILYLADAMKINEKYSDAIVEYNNYAAKVATDPRGAKGAESCALAQKWIDNPTRYEVKNEAQINGKNNDFSPSYASKNNKEILFTSSRDGAEGDDVDGWTGQSFTDVFTSKIDNKGKWSTPTPLDVIVNSADNEGSAVYDAEFKTLYFTRCTRKKKEAMGCEIFSSESKGSTWGEPALISLKPDSVIATIGHPALNADGSVLVFAADIPGGLGGRDIWVSTFDKEKKRWTKPVNAGSTINTPADEMFPFIHADGTLYFASSGHIGMGGLDIFKADKVSATSWANVTNMRYPINSAGDDFAIVFEREAEKGYFTSNRNGGKGADDIYSFILPQLQFTLQGVVKDFKSKKPVDGATVTIVGTDGSSKEVKTDASGFYKVDLMPATSYVLTAGKLGAYLNKTGKTTTVGFEEDKALVHDFELDPIAKPIDLPNIYYDLAKWELRPESKVALDGLIEVLTDNPTIVIELGSHTDIRSSDAYNLTLSQKRAQSVVDYLIESGISADRLVAKGYGETTPRVIPFDLSFMKKDDVITEAYINKLPTEPQKEEAHQMNRRTEFRVLRSDYVPKQN